MLRPSAWSRTVAWFMCWIAAILRDLEAKSVSRACQEKRLRREIEPMRNGFTHRLESGIVMSSASA